MPTSSSREAPSAATAGWQRSKRRAERAARLARRPLPLHRGHWHQHRRRESQASCCRLAPLRTWLKSAP